MSPRLVGLDLARWCALLAMMATHLLATREEVSGAPTWVAEVFSGRASALFAVLAGTSLALMTGGPRPWSRAGLVVRAVAVGVVGLLLGEVDSGLAVILVHYALLLLLALLVVGWGARSLGVLAVVLALGAPVLLWWVRPVLLPRGFANPSIASLEAPGHLLSELVVTGYYPVLVWSAYVVAGMALGRLDLRVVPSRVLALVGVLAAAVAALAEVASGRLVAALAPVEVREGVDEAGMYGQTPVDGPWQWLLVAAPHSSTPPDLLRTGGSAIAVVVACLLLLRALGPRAGRAVAVLAGAGAATLSLYVLHVLMTAGRLPPGLQVLVVVGSGAVLALVGRRGPLEAALARASGLAARRGG